VLYNKLEELKARFINRETLHVWCPDNVVRKVSHITGKNIFVYGLYNMIEPYSYRVLQVAADVKRKGNSEHGFIFTSS
jgi:hypothetical protein